VLIVPVDYWWKDSFSGRIFVLIPYYVVLQRQGKVLKIKLDCQILIDLQMMMVLNFGVDWISSIPACSDEIIDHEYRLYRIPVPLSCVFMSYAMAVQNIE
jgi:hypothetical protein